MSPASGPDAHPDAGPDDAGPADAGPGVIDDIIPSRGYDMLPIITLGGSAGAIPALQAFFGAMPPGTGLAYVVVLHLAPDHASMLADVLGRTTSMRVVEVSTPVVVEADTVYVIPPGRMLRSADGHIVLEDMPMGRLRHVAVDMFFRTVADTHGPHAAAIVLSGMGGDGAAGIKRVKEHGGLTIAQDPEECEHDSMPRSAIATGMVDWVLPVREMPARIAAYFGLEKSLRLPPEEPPRAEQDEAQEGALRDVLLFLRTRTGRNFFPYKRATIVRRIARRMQISGTDSLPAYLTVLRTTPGEAGTLLQDLLISVTSFFRDAEAFEALEREIPKMFEGKQAGDAVRVWVTACATGEEAYAVAMLLAEHARTLESPPQVHVFASDLDEMALQTGRNGVYSGLEGDVSEERLRRFFVKDPAGWLVRRELREMVLFAVHDLLKDPPFSRLDLVTCRNMLIYLNRDAQTRLLETFHFSLLPDGLLMLGSSESVEEESPFFVALNKPQRIFRRRSLSGVSLLVRPPIPAGFRMDRAPVVPGKFFIPPPATFSAIPREAAGRREASWSELHLRLLEHLGPPSILVDARNDIVHLSPTAGRYLQFAGGEPSHDLLQAVAPELRGELRTALLEARRARRPVEARPPPVQVERETLALTLRVVPVHEAELELYLVLIEATPTGGLPNGAGSAAAQPGGGDGGDSGEAARAAALARNAEREIGRVKARLRDTVEQYETSTEELKASNEELQSMNQELRSASEELETGREELQSINEELITVNHQLKSKVDELAHANSDMHNLVDATAIATVFLDRLLRITRYTPSALGLFNLIPSDVGRPLSDLAGQLQFAGLIDDAKAVLERLVSIEREVGHAGGNWYLMRILPYRTLDDHIAGVVLAFVDVTDARRAREALVGSEERLRLMLENAREYAIFSMDLQRRVTSWNAGAERLLGYTEKEIIGRAADVIFTEEDRALGAPAMEMAVAKDEGRAADERWHLRKDGSRFWGSGAMMLMRDSAGREVGLVKILRDETAARESKEALERSRQSLAQALDDARRVRDELRANDAVKDRFLAVLSHELRNPLASIDSAAAVLAAGGQAGDLVQAGGIVVRQAAVMKALLDDLLDLSRLNLGRIELRREVVGLDKVVNAALENVRPLLERARHELTVDVPGDTPLVHGDTLRLVQVVANLLSNAIKYTPPGGKLHLGVGVRDGQANIVVRDNGSGMEPGQVEQMFTMFSQGDPEGHGRDGLGIGLALARNIARLHGGQLDGKSEGPGRGSEFVFALPLAAKDAAARAAGVPAAAPLPAAAPPPAAGRGLVMLVDDNIDAAWALGHLLEAAGWAVVRASRGDEALELARTRLPQACVLDIGLPDMSGLDLARNIRAAPWGAGMLLIAVTGWGQPADEAASAQAGFDLHLTKPVNRASLAAALEQAQPTGSREGVVLK